MRRATCSADCGGGPLTCACGGVYTEDTWVRAVIDSPAGASGITAGHAAYLELLLTQGRYEGMRSILEILRPRYSNGLPTRLRLENDRVRVKLIVDQWQRQGSDGS